MCLHGPAWQSNVWRWTDRGINARENRMEGNLPSCGQRREISKCTSKLNIRVFFFHHLKVYNVLLLKNVFQNLFSFSSFVLTSPRNFFLRSQETNWTLPHMPEKNIFPQSRFSVVTSRHFRKVRKLSRVNFRKDLGTGQSYWPIAEPRVLSNDPRSLCDIWFKK